jgi:CRISPR/Cas system-associated protein endoribonuclease Cas2
MILWITYVCIKDISSIRKRTAFKILSAAFMHVYVCMYVLIQVSMYVDICRCVCSIRNVMKKSNLVSVPQYASLCTLSVDAPYRLRTQRRCVHCEAHYWPTEGVRAILEITENQVRSTWKILPDTKQIRNLSGNHDTVFVDLTTLYLLTHAFTAALVLLTDIACCTIPLTYPISNEESAL